MTGEGHHPGAEQGRIKALFPPHAVLSRNPPPQISRAAIPTRSRGSRGGQEPAASRGSANQPRPQLGDGVFLSYHHPEAPIVAQSDHFAKIKLRLGKPLGARSPPHPVPSSLLDFFELLNQNNKRLWLILSFKMQN